MNRQDKAALSRDLKALEKADRALRATTPAMRRATLEFLWDKWVAHAESRKDEEHA